MEGGTPNKVSPIFVVLIGIMAAAIVLTIYHCIVVTWYSPSRPIRRLSRRIRRQNIDSTTESAEFSTAGLVPPARIYSRKEGVVSEDQSTCSICLSDFKEGEEVRLLPECLHCFHLACIDVWLMSRTSCPMCRTDTGSVSVSMETLPREAMVRSGGARLHFL